MSRASPEPPDPEPVQQSLWQTSKTAVEKRRSRLKNHFLHMVGRDDPPEVVAASFALGVAISFTPLIGLHWVIALLMALILGLNKVDILLGTLVVNPLTLAPVSAAAIPLGRFLLRARREAIIHLPWREVLRPSFWSQARPAMRTMWIHWAVGMFALSLIAGALTYVILVRALRARRNAEGA